jgi:hypothetical protein
MKHYAGLHAFDRRLAELGGTKQHQWPKQVGTVMREFLRSFATQRRVLGG